MITSRVARVAATTAALALGLSAPASAQTQGAPSLGYDPVSGHYHEGELGQKALVLEHNLRCSCGCGLDLHSCQFQMQCGTSPVWAERIRRSLAAGESIEAIQASFVADFGNTVLMAPPPEGFNLVGYLLPGVAILAAGVLVGLIARGGMGRGTLAPVTELNEEDAERLRSAMRQLDEAEGPDW